MSEQNVLSSVRVEAQTPSPETAQSEKTESGRQPASASTPDPQTAKIKKLVAYWKRFGFLPEVWSSLTVKEKRDLFRRKFCPGPGSDDPLQAARERVAGLMKDDVKDVVHRLSNEVGLNYYELGAVLHRVSCESWYTEFGYEAFREWIEAETAMRYSKARYLIQIYTKLTELGIPWEKIRGIGWTRMREVLPVINLENVDRWLMRARHLSTRGLRQAIDVERGLHARGADGKNAAEPEAKTASHGPGQDEVMSRAIAKPVPDGGITSSSDAEGDEEIGKVNLRGCPDQVETVNAAIDQRMKDSGDDSRMVCLAAICAHYVTCQPHTARPQAERAEPQTLSSIGAMVGELLIIAKELARSDYEALEPIASQIDRHFPKAEVTIEANG